MTLLARTGIINTYTQPFSATGGTTTDSGGYRYHTFNASGNFVVASGSKTVESLVVGGGGSGGHPYMWNNFGLAYTNGGGGGGAGSFLSSSFSAVSGTYTITIGAGGVSGTTYLYYDQTTNSIGAVRL